MITKLREGKPRHDLKAVETTLYNLKMPVEMKAALAKASKAEGLGMSEIVRISVMRYLESGNQLQS